MEFAIIAAGEGSRLREEGFKFSKPMVVLQELTLINRLIKIFLNNGASKIHIIINESSPELRHHLADMDLGKTLNIIIKTTPSSLHSFYEIVPYITGNKICVTTVDTVFNETEFEAFISAFKSSNGIDGLMAATGFVDDESPLYIGTDNELNITGFFDNKNGESSLVSGGIYCLTRSVYPVIIKAIEIGSSRMRNFQRLMISEGLNLKAYPFSKIIDIDHVTDIEKAETFLRETALVS
jgi:NDP-sugar pyrophosphorylase family protein